MRATPPCRLGTVVLVRHRIHSGGFRAYALHFVSVFGSAKAGIHRDKLGGGLKSTASLPAWSRDSLIIALRRQAPPVAKMHSKLRLWSASSLDGDEPQWRGLKEFQWLSHDAGLSPSGCGHNQSKTKSDCWPPWRLGDRRCSPPPDSFRWFSGLCTTFRQCFW